LDKEIASIEEQTVKPAFWEQEENFQLIEELAKLKRKRELISMLESFLTESKFEDAKQTIRELFSDFCFGSSKYSKSLVVMSIYSGVGGKDAEDWTGLLVRMYKKFFQRQGWQFAIVDSDPNEFGGYKFFSFEIKEPVYSILNLEKGVHRLVRISPFSAQKLRHTSFAYVDVLPLLESVPFELKDKDLEFQTFRSSTKGGQNVNKLETAVRVIYKPLGLSVVCQSERFQHQNKMKALEILKARLLQLMEQQRIRELNELKGVKEIIGWGQQKRSYIMHPYQLVKDHQFGYETSKLEEVLDGNLALIHPLGAIL
jgi:peptide chain release factor 2